MAIYHLEGKIFSRSKGRSAVAASAYRACEKLIDERTGFSHDFTNKSHDLANSAILLPDNAPRELTNRTTLWNTVEATEKRKDAQLSRDFNISLPRELTDEQNWRLATEFVQQQFVDKGMIADIAMHHGHKGQDNQPHVHVMLTLRTVNENGFGAKERSWNKKSLLQEWRAEWANHCNLALARHGHDIRIDNRTLEAQGIDLEPQTKIGPTQAKAYLVRAEEHQEKARANGERIIANPSLLLDALIAQQSTFTERDIQRLVFRYTDDAKQYQQAYQKVMAAPELTRVGLDTEQHIRYSTHAQVAIERQLIQEAKALFARTTHRIPENIQVTVANTYALSAEQRTAYDYLVNGGDIRNLVGLAGTGKTYLLGAIREAYAQAGYRVVGMALAGKAAENMTNEAGIDSRTVASHLRSWSQGRDSIGQRDIVIVDEAGMLGSRQLAEVLSQVTEKGAKLITAFDSEQLQAIDAGAAARAVAEHTDAIELSAIRRQQQAWQREATLELATGKTALALVRYQEQEHVIVNLTREASLHKMLANWEAIAKNQPDKTQLLLAHTRQDVAQLNLGAREMLKAQGHLTEEQTMTTERGECPVAVGERIYFLRNDYGELNVRNGSLGTVTAVKDTHLSIKLDGETGREVQVDTRQYNDLTYGYATTLHKSQGSTVDYAHLLASAHIDRHLTYVGMSRHREGATLYWDKETFRDEKAMVETLSRGNPKDFILDYARAPVDERESRTRETTPLAPQDQKSHNTEVNPLAPQDLAPNTSKIETQPPAEKILTAQKTPAEREHYSAEFKAQLARASRNTGVTLSPELKAGENGIYRGIVEIEGQRYGVLDIGQGQGKLIPKAMLGNPERNKAMEISQVRDEKGLPTLQATQQALTRERAQQRDIGGYQR